MTPDIAALLKEHSGIRLDVACGAAKHSGYVGMDIRPLPGVDIVHDIESIPWPLPDECVLSAIASHIVEHINPVKFGFINWMNELWRVMKPDGEVAIACPHGYSPGYLQDPTHCNALNETTWAYFDPLEPNTGGYLYRIYRPCPWKITHLSWSPAANIEVILSKRRDDKSYHE